MLDHTGQPYHSGMWSILDQIDNLFYHLTPLPYAYDLYWDIVQEYENIADVFILTSLPLPTNKLITAADDKRRWVHHRLDANAKVHTVIGGINKKWFVNQKGDILIDDTQRNLDGWTSRGGTSILHAGDPKMTLASLEIAMQDN